MNRQTIPLKIIRKHFSDPIYCAGLILLAVTLIVFIIPDLMPVLIPVEEGFIWFCMNHAITVLYFCILLFSRRLRKGREGLHPFFLFLLMFLVSAYSLNRYFTIFEVSTTWFAITIVLCTVNYAAFAFLRVMPVPVRVTMFFLLGLSFCCFLYMIIYIGPYAILGIIASFFFGISLHALVPLLFCLYTIRLFLRSYAKKRTYKLAFLSGIGTTLLIVMVYSLIWRVKVLEMDKARYRPVTGDTYLPGWLNVAQHITPDFITERILKADMVYTTPDTWGASDSFFGIGPSRWNEGKKHDPLVMIAAALGGNSSMYEEDRIKVLKATYDSRYQAEERLWSGDDLQTTHVQTAARIWPRLRMAYTEKTVSVRNMRNAGRGRWRDSEEAIYIFHLPEGAVVSSLSLWINNKEEKGILTTKAKADSAYKTIVGVEQRDPSVVHWQEGNTVTVRVFPVLDNEERQFKIGITAPLSLEHGKLMYRNIYFDGPSIAGTGEHVDISFETPPSDLNQSGIFSKGNDDRLTAGGPYLADWEVSFKDEGLVHKLFSHNNQTFTVSPYRKELAAADIADVYLDVNNAWSKQEYRSVLALLNNKRVWVYVNDKMEQVTPANTDGLFEQAAEDRFSLFPFFQISQPATALVITKSVTNSPAINDLEEVSFMQDQENIERTSFIQVLKKWLGGNQHVMLYNLGGELSPYLRTLKECRTFRYDQGDIAGLQTLLDDHRFPSSIENDNRVVIETAGMTITRTPGTEVSTAPDHLKRLFAYNHIMHAMGPRLLTGGQESDTLVAEAAEAYVVTPLSSLVVLETQADYDRFNIEDSNNSLKNAGLKNKGAVPEPHEWLLIVLGLLLIAYLKYRPALFKRTDNI
ncbi:XrtN system VIT domain-containing protein [Chitinophaga sp. S165]|uniref:XrtN system VIT domain-containing protein n=1 Tax=Chitinophaga sp. S165 TaxID=2135462 RepID=UPI000D710E58|nr:XrtN system VIT domain-containing protein [Chitinophaga sp. S165]PWV56656.1 XrtN system VIT domain protein [Chitinophaga sp. S165]